MPGRREADLPSVGAFARGGDPTGRAASGAAAALAVALAVDLAAQVAGASPEWADRGGALAQADAIRDRALELACEIEEAFAAALEALEQASLRGPSAPPTFGDLDLGITLDLNVDLLLAIAGSASDAGALAELVARDGAPMVRADSVAATMLAVAAAEMATHLIEVNLLVDHGDDERLEHARRLVVAAAASRDAARLLGR